VQVSADPDQGASLGTSPSALLLTVAAVARRIGVAPATLRTWDRRYGLGPSSHVSGTHRRYTAADLERLQAMRRLTLAGMQAADAARAVLHLGAHAGAALAPVLAGSTLPRTPPTSEPDPVDPAEEAEVPGWGAGMPDTDDLFADPQQRVLARAALALDQATVADVLWRSLRTTGVVATWEQLLRPVLVAAGRRWELTGEGVEVEHLLAHTTEAVLRSYAVGAPEPASGRPVLLSAVPGEQHGLPLAALAAALAEQGLGSRVLGTDLPVVAFVAAVRRTGPSAVMLWSHLSSTSGLEVLDAMPPIRPAPVVLTGGGGWPVEALPAGVCYASGLAEARDLVVSAVEG